MSRAPMSARALVTGATILRGGPDQPPVPEVLSEDEIRLAVIPIRGPAGARCVLGAYPPRDRRVERGRDRLPGVARAPAVVGRGGRVGAARGGGDPGPPAGDPRQLAGRDRDQGPRGALPRHQPSLPRAARDRSGDDAGAHPRTTSPAEVADSLHSHDREVLRPRPHAAGRGGDGPRRRSRTSTAR